MAHVTLDRAEPGMTLRSNVVDRRGRLLVPAGADLSEKHISALKMWGVTSIEVEDDGVPAEDELVVDPVFVEEAERDVEALFVIAGDPHPALDQLRALAVRRRARELARAGVSA